MFITKSYKYEKDGIIYVSGTVTEGATVLEEMNILNAEEGYDLKRISDEEIVGSSIWLRDGDSEENYIEVEAREDGNNSGVL